MSSIWPSKEVRICQLTPPPPSMTHTLHACPQERRSTQTTDVKHGWCVRPPVFSKLAHKIGSFLNIIAGVMRSPSTPYVIPHPQLDGSYLHPLGPETDRRMLEIFKKCCGDANSSGDAVNRVVPVRFGRTLEVQQQVLSTAFSNVQQQHSTSQRRPSRCYRAKTARFAGWPSKSCAKPTLGLPTTSL